MTEKEADKLARLQTELERAKQNWRDQLPEMIRLAERELLLAKPKRTR